MTDLQQPHLSIRIHAPESVRDILVAWLTNQGFAGFEEQPDDVLVGFVPEDAYDEQAVRALLAEYQPAHLLGVAAIPEVNWNQAWESAFSPMLVDDFCQVVASFHPVQPGFSYTIVIDPKMSFGTGHHETTRLMMRHMRDLPVAGASVLDMGCGTGILAILAKMMGSAETMGIDIDRWSYENASENATLNQVVGIYWQQGDVQAIPAQTFDLILANINRNVLLADIPQYREHLAAGGHLVLSGFVQEDLPLIRAAAEASSLQESQLLEEGEWQSVTLIHKN